MRKQTKAVGRKVETWMRAKGAEMGEGEGEEGGMKGERGGREKRRKEGGPTTKKRRWKRMKVEIRG